MRYMRCHVAPRYGSAMIRLRGKFYVLRAPWCRPLFSERYGDMRVIRLGFGWRITVRDVGSDPA